MKENSIEEDIKDIEKYISFTSNRQNFSHDTDWNWNKDLANKIEHVLSDYKRALKENELLRTDIESWKKYCEEIEEEQTEMSNKNCELEFEIEKLQKENEELKRLMAHKNRYTKLLEDDLFENCSNYVIPIQKIKDKIKEIGEKIKYEENEKVVIYLHKQKNILQELLESED